MRIRDYGKEPLIVILASIILALSVAYRNTAILYPAMISFLIIFTINILTKKSVGYFLETKVRTKFWSWYQYGLKKGSHFKKPLTMAWLPLILSLFSQGLIWWFAILEFDVEAKTERVTKRHGLYRFTQVTEWHMAWIATWGIIANIFFAVIAYILGFELFTKLSIYFAIWSIIPLSSLDGSKIYFSSRGLWITLFTILLIFFGWGLIIN